MDIEIENNGDFFGFLAQELRRLPYVASRYAGWKVTWLLKGLVAPLLPILWFLGSRSKGSDQLLCFGFHVTAVKATGR